MQILLQAASPDNKKGQRICPSSFYCNKSTVRGEVIGDHFPSHNSDYFFISFNVSEPLPVVIRQKYMPAVQVEASRYL